MHKNSLFLFRLCSLIGVAEPQPNQDQAPPLGQPVNKPPISSPIKWTKVTRKNLPQLMGCSWKEKSKLGHCTFRILSEKDAGSKVLETSTGPKALRMEAEFANGGTAGPIKFKADGSMFVLFQRGYQIGILKEEAARRDRLSAFHPRE